MDSSPSFGFLPPPPPPNPNPNSYNFPPPPHHRSTTAATNLPTQNPDINTTLSTLKQLINLSKTTIHSLSNILPTTTTTTATVTCPYNSNHRVPPSSLFHHHLRCPSSPAPVDHSILESLHYPNSLKSPPINQNNNCFTNDVNADLCISLDDYHTSLDSNFFYHDCPAVVTFPQDNNGDRMLMLPAVLSAECAGFTGDGNDDMTDTVDNLLSNDYLVKMLPSEYYNVRTEIHQWTDYPCFYSHGVLRSIVWSYIYQEEQLMEWVLVNSPFYGVVIDVFMRDHIVLLFRFCLKAIAREATGYLVLISKGELTVGNNRFDCPVLIRVLTWLGLQFSILYGEINGRLFAINMLKQSLLNVSSKSLILYDESSGLSVFNGVTKPVNGSKEVDGSRKGLILVSQVAAAVAALHERFAFETRIKAIRASRFVPVYQRVQEHEYMSKKADEERKKRPTYRPIIEHDGVLWHRGGNQDSNKNKSQEELLAEERDYKRRRMSYRGKKMKRSTTQVMRDIIDEYMEEIKHANMAGQPFVDATILEAEPSSTSNVHADKHKHDGIKQKTLWKESVSDINMRSVRYEDEGKEKNNKHRHKDNRRNRRTKNHSSSPDNHHKSNHKDRRSSSIIQNEFEDRYDPYESHDNYD
ncbi:hypothetical protein R6Q59_019572 [Mikania micrantha]|uniref:CHHC U11-48K-type domain-containing protein n=1 Tax=Mikania micrantha TaxID=192012 RepID=A0A5N6PRV5_9ASTR|nr:hypothetical protein E3N88_07514 [Mikania micrantha]